MKAAFRAVGQKLPSLWEQGLIDQIHKKALLRSLIEKAVIHKKVADCIAVRIVWQGGAVSELVVAKTVGSWKDLTGTTEMEELILQRSQQGVLDQTIADELTKQGYRSPMAQRVLPSTVRGIRRKHHILQVAHQSHPRQVAGYLTVSQLARAIDIDVHWIYDRIHNRKIQVAKNARGTFLFPDEPETLAGLRDLLSGKVSNLDYRGGHQHV